MDFIVTPTLQQAQALAEGHTLLPIAAELFSDSTTSLRILQRLRQSNPHCFLLESVTGGESWGRYSFLGWQPAAVLRCTNGEVMRESGGQTQKLPHAPLAAVQAELAALRSPRIEGLPPFTGGLVGFFSYESARFAVPGLQFAYSEPLQTDDYRLMLVDKVIAFDHYRQKIVLICNIPAENLAASYAEGQKTLAEMCRLVQDEAPLALTPPGRCGPFAARFTEDAYCEAVRRIQHHITEGDVFQAVLANRHEAPFAGGLLHAYRVLRTQNPSPYMVYMQMDEMEIACASPETLVSVQGETVRTYPLAGTRPRGATPAEDEALAAELLQDPKELAEHDMLVDLGRNDLGRVSRFGSVQVEQYRAVKRFSHVQHIASLVTGQLAAGRTAVEALAATLPAGTLSGAPKRRAMEILSALEGKPRGVYGGALGYIDFAGNMDMCIGIRMAVRSGGTVSVAAGAGIVVASVPKTEYEETGHKARAMFAALAAEETQTEGRP